MIKLHLGCGNRYIKDAINVDIVNGPNVDKILDLNKLPWIWKDESIDGIYMFHLLEHFPDPKLILLECHRILKKGGFLHIVVPHSSCCASIGCMGHFRTYSYDTLRKYMSRPFYMFKKAIFKTTHQELLWWYKECTFENVPKVLKWGILLLNPIINFFIRLSPQVFENFWCYWVGGAKEVIWIGEKI